MSDSVKIRKIGNSLGAARDFMRRNPNAMKALSE